MATVTVAKTKYEMLERQAALYKIILKGKEEGFFSIEMYSPQRIKEFFKEDRINLQVKKKVEKLLKSGLR